MNYAFCFGLFELLSVLLRIAKRYRSNCNLDGRCKLNCALFVDTDHCSNCWVCHCKLQFNGTDQTAILMLVANWIVPFVVDTVHHCSNYWVCYCKLHHGTGQTVILMLGANWTVPFVVVTDHCSNCWVCYCKLQHGTGQTAIWMLCADWNYALHSMFELWFCKTKRIEAKLRSSWRISWSFAWHYDSRLSFQVQGN